MSGHSLPLVNLFLTCPFRAHMSIRVLLALVRSTRALTRATTTRGTRITAASGHHPKNKAYDKP